MNTNEIVGSSVILLFKEFMVFEIQPESKWRTDECGNLTVGVGCIGGSVEQSETPKETIHREALEEIATPIQLTNPKMQYHIDTNGKVTSVEPWNDTPHPLFCWQGTDTGYEHCTICTYLGYLESAPTPKDLPAVLLAPLRSSLDGLALKWLLSEHLRENHLIIERQQIPRQALLQPVGTVAVLLRLYKSMAPLFVELEKALI